MKSKLLWAIAATLSIFGVAPQASADLFELDMTGTLQGYLGFARTEQGQFLNFDGPFSVASAGTELTR